MESPHYADVSIVFFAPPRSANIFFHGRRKPPFLLHNAKLAQHASGGG